MLMVYRQMSKDRYNKLGKKMCMIQQLVKIKKDTMKAKL